MIDRIFLGIPRQLTCSARCARSFELREDGTGQGDLCLFERLAVPVY